MCVCVGGGGGGGGGGRIVGYEGVGVWFIPSLLPPFFLSLSFSLPHSGVWFTEYGYIDIDSTATSEAACNRQNNSDGYRRVWAPRDILQSPECLVLPGPPACMQGGWTRVNHLGNSRDGVPLNITWRIPYFPSNTAKLAVVRVR